MVKLLQTLCTIAKDKMLIFQNKLSEETNFLLIMLHIFMILMHFTHEHMGYILQGIP